MKRRKCSIVMPRPTCASRKGRRHVPERFSWLDHRLLRHGVGSKYSAEALSLDAGMELLRRCRKSLVLKRHKM